MATAINTGHINGQSPLIRAILMAVAINTARINGRAAVLMAVAINTGARRTWVLAHRGITRGSYGSTGSPPWWSARPWGSRARFCHCSQPRGLSGEKVFLKLVITRRSDGPSRSRAIPWRGECCDEFSGPNATSKCHQGPCACFHSLPW